MPAAPKPASWPAIPRSIWMLGFVSLFMDISSELIHSLLPVFMVSSLGATAFAVGIVEGIAELTALIGKGIRGAPRDALVADLAPPEIRGAAFGLRQSLDTVGAFLGPLLAIALMILLSGDFRAVFWFAVIPAVFAVLLLAFGVREPERGGSRTRFHQDLRP